MGIARQDSNALVLKMYYMCYVKVLLAVGNHAVIGSELLVFAGCRLAHFVFNCDPAGIVQKLAECSPSLSTWLHSMVSLDYIPWLYL